MKSLLEKYNIKQKFMGVTLGFDQAVLQYNIFIDSTSFKEFRIERKNFNKKDLTDIELVKIYSDILEGVQNRLCKDENDFLMEFDSENLFITEEERIVKAEKAWNYLGKRAERLGLSEFEISQRISEANGYILAADAISKYRNSVICDINELNELAADSRATSMDQVEKEVLRNVSGALARLHSVQDLEVYLGTIENNIQELEDLEESGNIDRLDDVEMTVLNNVQKALSNIIKENNMLKAKQKIDWVKDRKKIININGSNEILEKHIYSDDNGLHVSYLLASKIDLIEREAYLYTLEKDGNVVARGGHVGNGWVLIKEGEKLVEGLITEYIAPLLIEQEYKQNQDEVLAYADENIGPDADAGLEIK